MDEDGEEFELGLAGCLSRGGAVVAGLTAAGLAQLEDEEFEPVGALVHGYPIPPLPSAG